MTSPSRLFADLSAREARATLDRCVTSLADRVSALREYVALRGGPADRLDLSRESLVPLWAWVVATHRYPEHPATDAEMRAADPPWWYEFYAGPAQLLGPDNARLVAFLAAYMGSSIVRRRPDATWVLGAEQRGWDYQMPLLAVPGGLEIAIDTLMLTFSERALRREMGCEEPDYLLRQFDAWSEPAPGPGATVGQPPYEIGTHELAPFNHEVLFSESVAHLSEGRVARFVEELRREPGIISAIHEDREVVLVQAPALTAKHVEIVAARAWRRTGPAG